MKRIFVTFLVASFMVFALAAATMANSVYFDYLTGGTFNVSDTDFDFTGMALGANFNSDKLTFNLEYAQDTIDFSGVDMDVNALDVKGGYILSGDAQNHLALTAGYNQSTIADMSNIKMSGILVGLDFVSAGFEVSAGYSVSGTCKEDGSEDSDIDVLQLKAKYSYFFTESFGLGVGYKYTKYSADNEGITMSGPVVGVTYKF